MGFSVAPGLPGAEPATAAANDELDMAEHSISAPRTRGRGTLSGPWAVPC